MLYFSRFRLILIFSPMSLKSKFGLNLKRFSKAAWGLILRFSLLFFEIMGSICVGRVFVKPCNRIIKK